MKTYLFVDGTNLYSAQYELFGPNQFLNFVKFINSIEKHIKIKFDKIFFYASYTPKRQKMSAKKVKYIVNEFNFYKNVQQIPNLIFFKGYRSKTSGKEKEVDVKISVDLVGYGLLKKYSQGYILSGDADFLQAVFFLKKFCPTINMTLLCMMNKIMFKGLFYLPSYIIAFSKSYLKKPKIARRSKILFIKKTAELCPRLG